MKSPFSINWLFSTQPRKQRKFRFNAPLHIKGKFMRAPLSKELSKKYEMKNTRVRKGDKVRLMRGQFKGKTALVDKVDLARERIYIVGIELVKKDGGKVPYPVHPSNVQIIELVDDKRRFKKAKEEKK